MKPYGLVLAGGGAKGAYQIGAWKAMREIGVTFEAVSGVSIGSINGAFIAADDYKNAVEFWNIASIDKGVKTEEPLPDPENLFSRKNWGVLFKEFMKNKGFDASPVNDFLKDYIDEEKVRKSGIPLAIVTVQMTQGVNPLELFIDDIPQGALVDYLLASSNIPLANNIGPEGEHFLDGGIYDNIPVSVLKKNGYNRLVVVDISSIKGVNHSLDLINSQIVYIRPYNIDDLGAAFDFDNDMIEKRIKMGYLDAKKAFSYLLGKIYYFEPKTYRNMVRRFGGETVSQLEDLAYEMQIPRLEIYTEEEFLSAVKFGYEEYKAKKEAEKAEEKNKGKEKDIEKEGIYATIMKLLSRKKDASDFEDAIAVLEGLN
ncbi:MAG: patatin-like phospholipase family protein [Faecalibacterium sp.]|nr:patatin-like phospholipase family protein [Ruminococcus sp.]MCM1391971.1 patatin-like phospholipase family protein [Ruminococcus sp.]MCM1485070.1 patatin-like phospholipase family protein [Faecalibacterium sp.]